MNETKSIMEASKKLMEARKFNVSPESEKYVKDLQSSISKIFPKSAVVVDYVKNIGEPYLSIRFTIGGGKSEYNNGYAANDPMLHNMMVHDFLDSDGNIIDGKVKMDVLQGKSILIAPEEGSYLAYDRLKTGLRAFTTTPDKIPEKLIKYFKKLKDLAKSNMDKFSPHHIDVIKKNVK